MNTDEFKDKMANTAGKAKETANTAMDMAGEAGRTVKTDLKTRAADTMETVREAASERAGAARDTLVGAGDRLSDTLEAEAQSVEGIPSRVLHGLADGVATVTDGLRGSSIGDLMAEAQAYARRHPGTFAVGAAVAGFALARFLRSSQQSAEARAADTTDRIYRDAARRTVDNLGDGGPRA